MKKTVQELENIVLTYEKSLSAYNNQLANYTKLYPKAGKTVLIYWMRQPLTEVWRMVEDLGTDYLLLMEIRLFNTQQECQLKMLPL